MPHDYPHDNKDLRIQVFQTKKKMRFYNEEKDQNTHDVVHHANH